MLSPGMVLAGKYKIHSVIGEGDFGQVYLAYDFGMSRYVAIKELLRDAARISPEKWEDYEQRFCRETRTVGQFTHPNVVGAYALETDAEGNLYLVLEYVDGGSLKQLLQSGSPLDIERALGIAIDLCRAIEAIYRRDIVHRDIKPGNILVTADGVAKLTDFGVAQVGHETRRTQETLPHPGTLAYKSPEQATSTGYLDQRSDLYSLGLVLYEMLTGRLYVRDRLPPRHLNAQIPPALDAVVTKALQQDPRDRYQTAAEMRRDLERIQRESLGGQLRIVLGRLSTRQIVTVVGVLLALLLITRWDRLARAWVAPVASPEPTATVVAQSPVPSPLPEAAAVEEAAPQPTGEAIPRPAGYTGEEPSVTPTLAWNDAYEPDDESPAPISVGETQSRSFAPERDVDRAVLRVKAGRSYLVTTANLGVGVDTVLEVQVNGRILSNDDIAPGTLASQVTWTAGEDGLAVITVTNQDQYGPERTYDLSVFVIEPTAAPTSEPTATFTLRPSLTPRATYTPRPTFTPYPTLSRTPTLTRTATHTRTPYMTRTPTRTRTPSPTRTPSNTPLPTDTPAPSATPLPTETPTPERTALPVKTIPPVR